EGCSQASGRALYGCMCDRIARELGTPEEFLVSEEGRNWTGRNGSLKMLKEMPQYLQILVMTIPSGYMCRLIRYPFNKIPTDLANIDDLIKIVHDMLVDKLCIIQCLDCSNNSNNVNIISNKEFKQCLKKKISELQKTMMIMISKDALIKLENDELVFKNGHIRERTEIADESIGNSKIVSENDSREDQAPEIIELSSDEDNQTPEDERTPKIIMILVIFIEQTPETARMNGQQIKFVC
ncbi:4487_t:CDS:2, partial [Gigaspora margarita]